MHGKVNITYINLFAYARKNKNNIYKIKTCHVYVYFYECCVDVFQRLLGRWKK